MWIILGKVMMLFVWCMLLWNLFMPFPRPLLYFMYIGLLVMVIMHSLQMLLFKVSLGKEEKLTACQQISLFLFGVFQLLAWRKKWVPPPSN